MQKLYIVNVYNPMNLEINIHLWEIITTIKAKYIFISFLPLITIITITVISILLLSEPLTYNLPP